MPFVQLYVPAKFTQEEKTIISRLVHECLIDVFKIPADDYFHVINAPGPGNLIYPNSYLGIPHTDNLIYVYITCGTGRTIAMKQELYAAIAQTIANRTPVTANDVIIILNEVPWENWSFGQGKAQMLK